MELHGIHHITAITGDAPANVEFYVGVLGLRMVKKTVNQDDPSVYHLFYADEAGSPGSDLTFFEYPGVGRGLPGAGMVHRIVWRVGSEDALGFWDERLRDAGLDPARIDASLRFADPEGLEHELIVYHGPDAPLVADAPDVPAEHALQGFDGVRAYSREPGRSAGLLRDVLGFGEGEGGMWEVRGERRGGFYAYDAAPSNQPMQGAGSVHHVAFASLPDEHADWRERVAGSRLARPTPVIDRFYFKSIYFREPSGVLFEIATIGPGFGADEDPAHLGERLSLPPRFERLREQVERTLTPLPDPRARRATTG
ncbi:MAG TPA: VOC family protein [Solirubrobacteraceae bacterium]|nr:VOC family protein [Solirubrobacteraceae bacterium]